MDTGKGAGSRGLRGEEMDFANKLAVVTGGGSGMGRELVVQLAGAGCSVATCDVNESSIKETAQLANAASPSVKVSTHLCDVSDEQQVLKFRDGVVKAHDALQLDLCFNNAGIGGGGSLITDPRSDWERTFAIDFWGVYYCTRAFLPLLMKSEEAMLVNTSSVNGFWASLGPGIPHTAYSAAKFAVKGLSEALIEDFRVNAPNVKVAVVMPGHIGTDIIANSRRVLGLPEPEDMSDEQVRAFQSGLISGFLGADASPDEILKAMGLLAEGFKITAPLTAADAAREILDGVRRGKWRILVGRDAELLDASVRSDPEHAYDHKGTGLFAGHIAGSPDT